MYKHGLTRHGWQCSTYRAWAGMNSRYYNKNCPKYKSCGAVGIKVCEALRASAVNLVALIGLKPTKDLSLDRINWKGNYSCGDCAECVSNGWPRNIRWADAVTQNRNRYNTRWIEIDGVTKSFPEWCLHFGVDRGFASNRWRVGKRGNDVFDPKKRINQYL